MGWDGSVGGGIEGLREGGFRGLGWMGVLLLASGSGSCL